MASRDLYNTIKSTQSMAPAARTATANGTGVDLKGYHSAVAIIEVGARTDGTHTFELQESDDNSTFTAVADADLQGTEPAVAASGDQNKVYELGYLGKKRYLRVKVTVSGATSGAVYGATIVTGTPAKAPTH
jgi:hypothetical protein